MLEKWEFPRTMCGVAMVTAAHQAGQGRVGYVVFKALRQIIQENWNMRSQMWHLAVVDLQKSVRGAVLGWFWLFVRPITYIAVFWFALELGLRASETIGDTPYLFWLSVGIIPWLFFSRMLTGGANVYSTYSYLVNRVQFPLSVISTFYALGNFIIFMITFIVMIIVALILGVSVTVYWLQLPLLILILFIFSVLWSIMTAPLAALSKDFRELIKALGMPTFWLSGVIFNVENIGIPGSVEILHLNPMAFFATSFRAALCNNYWIWENPKACLPFVAVFLIVFLLALRNYSRLRRVVPDVV
ncbi:MAG: ABC transporter permease [Coriobacteriales bacterium]|jgi:teichoic acid transport system permease protein|nr:ABC transporter permease [Coriobacteriales bacterium]